MKERARRKLSFSFKEEGTYSKEGGRRVVTCEGKYSSHRRLSSHLSSVGVVVVG